MSNLVRCSCTRPIGHFIILFHILKKKYLEKHIPKDTDPIHIKSANDINISMDNILNQIGFSYNEKPCCRMHILTSTDPKQMIF